MNRATGRIAGMVAGLLLLAILPSQLTNAGEPSPALTLVDAGTWAPTASLDTSQVEAAEIPAEQQYADEFGQSLGEGWEPFNGDVWESDTLLHTDCWINVGETSVIACPSGFTALS